MRRIIDLETLYEWAREQCEQSGLSIWIGEDTKTKDIMLNVQGEYAIISPDCWLHDVQWLFEETIKLAKEKQRR